MRTAMRLSTLSAPLASFAANSKPFFPLFFAWVSPLPPPARAKGRRGGWDCSPTDRTGQSLHQSCGTRWGGAWGEFSLKDVLHALPF